MMEKYLYWLEKNALTIYLLHGVIKTWPKGIRNYLRKHILQKELIQLCSLLTKQGISLTPDEVVHHITTKTPFPNNSFLLTFDDGFLNNYTVAAPVLNDFNVGAIFYVTSSFIEENLASWTDQIEHAIDITPKGKIKLPWEADEYVFTDNASKIYLMEKIRSYVKNVENIDPFQLAEDIYSQLKLEYSKKALSPIDAKMGWKEVKELYQSDIFTIGGHSHSHKILSFLTEAELEEEVETSMTYLREKVGISKLIHYSYPEGLQTSYNEQVINLLKDKNILMCPTAIEYINFIDDDPFQYGRIWVL